MIKPLLLALVLITVTNVIHIQLNPPKITVENKAVHAEKLAEAVKVPPQPEKLAVAAPVQPQAAPPPATGCEAVRAEVSKYPGWNVSVITAIAKAESNCRVEATGDGHLTYQLNGRVYGYSVSALQVRILPGREHCDKHDLATNVQCAYNIWKGQGYNAWTMYLNGVYRQFL